MTSGEVAYIAYRCSLGGKPAEWAELSCAQKDAFEAAAWAVNATHTRFDSPRPIEPGPPLQRPSIGCIVHYTNLGDKDGKFPPEQQAAVITGVNADGTVALKVFYKTGLFDMASAPYSEKYERGHWSWVPKG